MDDSMSLPPEVEADIFDAFQDMVASRGGWRNRCDFCGHPFSEAWEPLPAPNHRWACINCLRDDPATEAAS
jgi:hypothetical protein